MSKPNEGLTHFEMSQILLTALCASPHGLLTIILLYILAFMWQDGTLSHQH